MRPMVGPTEGASYIMDGNCGLEEYYIGYYHLHKVYVVDSIVSYITLQVALPSPVRYIHPWSTLTSLRIWPLSFVVCLQMRHIDNDTLANSPNIPIGSGTWLDVLSNGPTHPQKNNHLTHKLLTRKMTPNLVVHLTQVRIYPSQIRRHWSGRN